MTNQFPLLVISLVILCLNACGTSKVQNSKNGIDHSYAGQRLALIVVEDWKLSPPQFANSFSKIVKRDLETYGEGGGKVGQIGCLPALALMGQASDGDDGYIGLALVGFCVGSIGTGYLTGYGIGAIMGIVRGAVAVFDDDLSHDDLSDINSGLMVTAFAGLNPRDGLAEAIERTTRRKPDLSLTRLESARASNDYSDLAKKGYPAVVVLQIRHALVGTYGDNADSSQLYVAVKGALVDTATNETKISRYWSYARRVPSPAKLAENRNALLKAEMKKAWAKISSEITQILFTVPDKTQRTG